MSHYFCLNVNITPICRQEPVHDGVHGVHLARPGLHLHHHRDSEVGGDGQGEGQGHHV